MEIIHRIGFHSGEKDLLANMEKLGIQYQFQPLQIPNLGMIIFDISESQPEWAKVSDIVKKYRLSDIYDTYFREQEILDATYLRLLPNYFLGYPQPSGTWIKHPNAYDLICVECNTFQQTSSFQIAKEPKLRERQLMSLFWTKAIFGIPEVMIELKEHEIQGYEDWDVILYKRGRISQNIRQIYMPIIIEPGSLADDYPKRRICPTCGTSIYVPHTRGIMKLKRDSINTEFDFIQTNEWFGMEKFVEREIIVSNRMARIVLENGWKGVRFKVVELL
jgi:hypothetical protein